MQVLARKSIGKGGSFHQFLWSNRVTKSISHGRCFHKPTFLLHFFFSIIFNQRKEKESVLLLKSPQLSVVSMTGKGNKYIHIYELPLSPETSLCLTPCRCYWDGPSKPQQAREFSKVAAPLFHPSCSGSFRSYLICFHVFCVPSGHFLVLCLLIQGNGR